MLPRNFFAVALIASGAAAILLLGILVLGEALLEK